ncbi:MAG: C-GCAxxG-C-C family protein [Chloroflexota bacterium]|nr:C-GCAxxG-C-C family protein [Chloroflexota bacterium]
MKSDTYRRQSKKLLFTTFNCAKSQLIPLQVMQEIHNDDLIMALTGLAGGILNNGSTCGVVIGGAISSAMVRDKELSGQWTLEDEIQLLDEIRADVTWFENRFGTSLCRERAELNYQRITVLGLLNPQKVRGCVARAGASMEHFVEKYNSNSETLKVLKNTCKKHDAGEQRNHFRHKLYAKPLGFKRLETCEHCAQKILREIREKTGIGSEKLERISVALDGGMGLSGGGCGALSGALMALGLKYALDPKETEPDKLRNIYRAMDSEFFRMAKLLVSSFIKKFEYLECSRITAAKFKNWAEFSEFRNNSSCDILNKFLVKKTIEVINFEE